MSGDGSIIFKDHSPKEVMPQMSQRLYPPCEAWSSQWLDVGDGHQIYVEQSGCKEGVPVLFLHGGPGGSCDPWHRRLFDPKRFRAVLFDQRGCGQSRPHLSLEANSTDHLIADIETIRCDLNIERWIVFGGSWGSTLALAYGQAFPSKVLGFVLRGVFLGTQAEIDWAFEQGPKRFRPDLWAAMQELLPVDERGQGLGAWGQRILHLDPNIARSSAWAWHDYEHILSCLDPGDLALPSSLTVRPTRLGAPGSPVLEWHYINHDFFLKEDQIIANIEAISAIPAAIIQGRYDLLCPPLAAHRLAVVWGKQCHLQWSNAGHSASEGLLADVLIAALNDQADRL